jgi:hypothetical protein
MNPTPPIPDKASPLALKIALEAWPDGQPNVHYGHTVSGVWSFELNENAKQRDRDRLADRIDTVLKPELDLLNRVAEAAENYWLHEGSHMMGRRLEALLAELKQFRAEGGK